MDLEYQPRFDQIRANWRTFWQGTNTRPMLHAVAMTPGVEPAPKPPWYEQPFGDLDDIAEGYRRWGETHTFIGDAIPAAEVNFCPDHFSLLLGAELEIDPDAPQTTWVVPFVTDWETDALAFRPECRWWERTVEAIRAFQARCEGRMIVTTAAMNGGLDTLAAIRGPQNLLMDLVDRPEQVHAALKAVHNAWTAVREALDKELGRDIRGDMNRFGMYTEGSIGVPQCDFSSMIGSDMFDEFELPALQRETGWLDHSIYHLDGPDTVRHLDSVCSLEGLDMIQWMPGAGHFEDDWEWLYDRVDALGKGQIFQSFVECSHTQDAVVAMWERMRSRKLFFHLAGEAAEHADRLIERLNDKQKNGWDHSHFNN